MKTELENKKRTRIGRQKRRWRDEIQMDRRWARDGQDTKKT